MLMGVSGRLYKERLKQEGMGTHEKALRFLNQDYEALKQECLENGTLFEDPQFPAVPTSIGFKELAPHSSKTRGIIWKRPQVRVLHSVLNPALATSHSISLPVIHYAH
ncbi:hypothetical protein chiPu_0022561 [Chiloscyllium punctatum]|uniref:Calpain catalytic domain-containing protein n=1 Tax=Chiloscyllium punctatum TaxID=137246 RepID=A0A401RDX6_CHIPU|nr:hypothetical protein [Chiloscyllium punctatum]